MRVGVPTVAMVAANLATTTESSDDAERLILWAPSSWHVFNHASVRLQLETAAVLVLQRFYRDRRRGATVDISQIANDTLKAGTCIKSIQAYFLACFNELTLDRAFMLWRLEVMKCFSILDLSHLETPKYCQLASRSQPSSIIIS